MHCFEGALIRNCLFQLVLELDPVAVRDDLALDEMLDRHGIDSLQELLELDSDRMFALVQELSGQWQQAA